MADTNPPDFKSLNDSVSSLNQSVGVLTSNVGKLAETFSQSSGSTDRLAQDFDKISLNAKSLVSYVGDWKEALQGVLDLSKKLSQGGIYDAKTFGNAKRRLTDLIASQNKLATSGKYSAQQQLILERALHKTNDALTELERRMKKAGKTMESSLDEDTIIALNRHLRESVVHVDKLSDAFKKVHVGPITSGIKTLNQLLGRSGRVERFAALGQTGHEIRETAKARSGTNSEMFRMRRNQLQQNLKKRGDFLNLPFDDNGNLDVSALKQQNRKRNRTMAQDALGGGGKFFGDVAGQLSGKTGVMGIIDRALGKRALRGVAEGVASGGEVKGIAGMGMKLMNMGGGSMTQGMGVAAESGLGGLGSLAGRAAVPLAIISAIKDLFDMTTKANREVYENLGTAGIFNGPEKGQQALQNVRTNLTPGGLSGFYDPLGNTYGKNLKIAQTIAESGVNMSDLATGGNNLNKNIVGKFGETVYKGGRLAGLDEVSTTREMIKLLQQYHESISTTDQFFDKLAKDTKAAGITTTKYLQIIDSITGSFDQMAKSIDDVTGVLRILGSTGVSTSDMVQEAMKALIGEQKSMEQKAFLGAQLLQNPDQLKQVVQGRQATAQTIATKAGESLLRAGVDTSDLDLTSQEGIQRANARLNNYMQGKTGTFESQQAGAGLEEARASALRLERVRRLQKTGDVVNYAAMGELVPEDFQEKASMQVEALQTASKYAGTKSIRDLTSNPALLQGIAKSIGVDPKDFFKLQGTLGTAASTFVNQGKQGNLSDEEMQQIMAAAERLFPNMQKGGTAKDRLNTLKPRQLETLTNELADNSDMLFKVINSGSSMSKALKEQAERVDKDEKTRKATEIAVATRQTSEIFADAFQNLFNQITRPLTYIADMLEDFFHKDMPKADQTQVENLSKLYDSKSDDRVVLAQALENLKKDKTSAEEELKEAQDSKSDDATKKAQDKLAAIDTMTRRIQNAGTGFDTYGGKLASGQVKYQGTLDAARDAFGNYTTMADYLQRGNQGHGDYQNLTAYMAKQGLNPDGTPLVPPAMTGVANQPGGAVAGSNAAKVQAAAQDTGTSGTTIIQNTTNFNQNQNTQAAVPHPKDDPTKSTESNSSSDLVSNPIPPVRGGSR